jgi:hypothetical protein
MTTTTAGLFRPAARYAESLHAAAEGTHHVASPLGAWLLLALCGPATTGAVRAELTAVLGMDVDAAARAAAELLGRGHPLVLSAAALWQRPVGDRAGWRPGWADCRRRLRRATCRARRSSTRGPSGTPSG